MTRVVQDSLAALPAFVDAYEIIVVDDGSRDRTGEIVAGLAAGDDRIRLVSHGRNRGYGAALISGFEASTGDFVMFMDADRQFNIRDLRLLVPFAGEYDIVAGFRMERSDPLHRRVLAEMFDVSVRSCSASTCEISTAPSSSFAAISCAGYHSPRQEH